MEMTKVTEEWQVDTLEQAEGLIEKAKADSTFTLAKYSCDKKEKKLKGEVVDSWFVVKLTKTF
jgi:hypothetical protein